MDLRKENRITSVLIVSRQFLDCYQTQKGYSNELKHECLTIPVPLAQKLLTI